jgi:hypothetical protein
MGWSAGAVRRSDAGAGCWVKRGNGFNASERRCRAVNVGDRLMADMISQQADAASRAGIVELMLDLVGDDARLSKQQRECQKNGGTASPQARSYSRSHCLFEQLDHGAVRLLHYRRFVSSSLPSLIQAGFDARFQQACLLKADLQS